MFTLIFQHQPGHGTLEAGDTDSYLDPDYWSHDQPGPIMGQNASVTANQPPERAAHNKHDNHHKKPANKDHGKTTNKKKGKSANRSSDPVDVRDVKTHLRVREEASRKHHSATREPTIGYEINADGKDKWVERKKENKSDTANQNEAAEIKRLSDWTQEPPSKPMKTKAKAPSPPPCLIPERVPTLPPKKKPE